MSANPLGHVVGLTVAALLFSAGTVLAQQERGGQLAESLRADLSAAEGDAPVTIDGPPPPTAPEVISRDMQGRVTVRAVRLPEGLVIDGNLDEPAYARVPALTGFIQQEPNEGEVEDRGLDLLRRSESLHRLAQLGQPSGAR